MEKLQKKYEEKMKDLAFQLTFEAETFDWDYFIDTAKECQRLHKRLFVKGIRISEVADFCHHLDDLGDFDFPEKIEHLKIEADTCTKMEIPDSMVFPKKIEDKK